MTHKYKRLTELEFGNEMLLWSYKGTYPLEAISMVVFEDAKGTFYAPAIADYVTGDLMITGNSDGYDKREQALRCVGRAWDKAEAKGV